MPYLLGHNGEMLMNATAQTIIHIDEHSELYPRQMKNEYEVRGLKNIRKMYLC